MSRKNPPAPKLRPQIGRLSFRIRRGLTLIEMLIAMAITLVMMAAVVTLFANISASIRNRRAMIELGGQLRQVRQRLALDLAGATCNAKTWQRPGENRGYIEISEGIHNDADPSTLLRDSDGDGRPDGIDFTTSLIPSGGDPAIRTPATANLNYFDGDVTNAGALGDWDDILALTVRSQSEPFIGRVPVFNSANNTWTSTTDQSNYAEVIWFATENPKGAKSPDEPGMRRIYRRGLLVSPSRALPPLANFNGSNPLEKLQDYYRQYDVSARVEGSQLVANTLGDLTKREFRFGRLINSAFPHLLDRNLLPTSPDYLMLNDALALDIRVFDPGAPLYQSSNGAVVQPGDPGWTVAAASNPPPPVGFGAYCDLGWGWDTSYQPNGRLLYDPPNPAIAPIFNFPREVGWHPALNTSGAFSGYPAVYDTWSFHYENNGLDEETILENYAASAGIAPPPSFQPWRKTTSNNQPLADQGTNGLDDDGFNGVDDAGERETSPPYDNPLRGIQVKLRVYERDARQVRETSVTHSFVQ